MAGQKARILLLEDDEDYVDTLKGYLEDDYEVYPAASLRKARKLLDQQTFHLAIVDISLVLGDSRDEKGFRLIEDLRTTEILRDMSIIIVTAYPSEERMRKAFKDYRVHDFIDKMTLDPTEFKKEVADAIAESYKGVLSDKMS
jgi:response regulator RpfG family c-di-GMP phosphodiesterase